METETTQTTETSQTPAPTEVTEVTEVKTEVVAETPVEPVAPEKYELKPSESSLLTKEQIADIETFAKSKNMSNEHAQELLAKQESAVSSYNKQVIDSHMQQVEAWKQTISKDPEIGGDKLGANMELTKRALEHFTTPEFMKELDATGFGNHPEFFKMMQKIGASMADGGQFIKGAPASTGKKTAAEIFYGDSNKK